MLLGLKKKKRLNTCVKFVLKGSILITIFITIVYILLYKGLMLLINRNLLIVDYGRKMLISQAILYIAFGLCYMMTITYQTIGESDYGLFLSMIRQDFLYIPFIIILPKIMGVKGFYLCQQLTGVLTIIICLLSIKKMKKATHEHIVSTTD